MAVKVIANYAKRLGLPGYSSHQFSVSVETELSNVEDVAGESARLYATLQQAVDDQIQNTGFVPPHGYGMNGAQNGNGQNGNGHNGSNGSSANGHGRDDRPRNGNGNGHESAHSPSSTRNADRWNCTEGQQGLILRVVHENKLDKNEVEQMAQQLFGVGVKELNKLQASQLIEDLLERTGRKQSGSRWRNRQPARS